MSYSKARLEGRALEHTLAGDRCVGIRMKDSSGRWHLVNTPQSREIRREMKSRVESLLAELIEQGFTKLSADSPARLGGDHLEPQSVDLVLRGDALEETALLEVKWTRQSMRVAHNQGVLKLPVLKQCCIGGRWLRSRKEIKAKLYGVLVVGPSRWQMELTKTGTVWKRQYPIWDPEPRKRKPRPSGWAAYRGNARPGSSLWPSGAGNWQRRRLA